MTSDTLEAKLRSKVHRSVYGKVEPLRTEFWRQKGEALSWSVDAQRALGGLQRRVSLCLLPLQHGIIETITANLRTTYAALSR
jgi:hypothetical protein